MLNWLAGWRLQVGNYKTEAYYTESLDLIKKLFLGGMIMFIHPGA